MKIKRTCPHVLAWPSCEAAAERGTRAVTRRQNNIQLYTHVAVALSSLEKKSGDLFGRRLLLTENKC